MFVIVISQIRNTYQGTYQETAQEHKPEPHNSHELPEFTIWHTEMGTWLEWLETTCL